MKKKIINYTITKSNFLNWYFNGSDDYEYRELGISIKNELLCSPNGDVVVNVNSIWDQCETSVIPLRETEQYNEVIHEDRELQELNGKYTITLID